MRDNKEILRSSKAYATEKRGWSWWHLVSTVGAAAVLVAVICLVPRWTVRLPASLLLGLVNVRLFILYHDVLHGTILRSSVPVRYLAWVYGLLVLSPPRIWARSHDHHHRNNGRTYGASIGSYAIMTRAAYRRAGRGARFGYALSRHPLTIACSYLTVFLFGMCLRSFLVDPRRHVDSGLSIVLHAIVLVLLAVVAPALMWLLVVLPMTVGCGLGGYLFYAQHNFPDMRVFARDEWTYCDAAMRSSSFIRMGPVMRWFTGNIGYHHVHHLNARIPFYRLPEAMAGIEELQHPGTTSLRMGDVWRCLGLKIWDVRSGCMVGFRAAR